MQLIWWTALVCQISYWVKLEMIGYKAMLALPKLKQPRAQKQKPKQQKQKKEEVRHLLEPINQMTGLLRCPQS